MRPTFFLLLLSLLSLTASSQEASTMPSTHPGGGWIVSLLTCEPGNEIYELEGHSGLRLRHSSGSPDMVVNWGIFDFASPGFVYRFTKGETDYMAGAAPTELFLGQYNLEGRAVTEQVLALTPEESDRVYELVAVNLLPENRVYRYNYVGDNCATRPLAIIEQALGDTLTLGAPEEALAGGRSFREAMRYYHRNYAWYQMGIDLALGSAIDRPEPQRAMSFSPVALSRMISTARRPDGKPLVEETTVIGPWNSLLPEGPTPLDLHPLTWAIGILVLTIGLTVYGLVRRRLCRAFDAVLYSVFGLAGCVIAFLVFISVHEAASPNWLLLWLNPLCLLVPALIWSKKGRYLLMWWQFINFVALMGLCVVWIGGIQAYNGAFIPLVISDMIRSLYFIYYIRCISPSSLIRSPRDPQ